MPDPVLESDPSAPLAKLSDCFVDVVAAAAPSIVSIHSHRSRASGFVWRPGLIVTADEALAEEGKIAVVLPGGQTVAATLAGRDPTTDVALLRVESAALVPVKLSASSVKPGALALVVGSQQGVPLAALGMVATVGPAWSSLRGGEIDARIEISMSLRSGAEGGLALDASGRALGMAVFGPRRRVLVIPAVTLERVAAKLASHGRIPRGYLGLNLHPVRVKDDGFGAMVMSVDPDGPAAPAGIRQGDVIIACAGRTLDNIRTLLRALGPESVGTTLALSLKRAGEPVEVKLTISERPEA